MIYVHVYFDNNRGLRGKYFAIIDRSSERIREYGNTPEEAAQKALEKAGNPEDFMVFNIF